MQHAPAIDDQGGPIRQRMTGINVPAAERIASVATGLALVVIGLRRRGVLAGLGAGTGAALIARGASGHCPLYRHLAMRGGVEVRRSITVPGSRHEVYAVLRDLRNLPRFMSHLEAVEEHGLTSRWVAAVGPIKLVWLSELVEDAPDLGLAWRSVPGGELVHDGTIELEDAPGRRGTQVTIALRFQPPAGTFPAPLAGLLRTMTSHRLASDLIRLRQLLAAGELVPSARPDDLGADDRSPSDAKAASGRGHGLNAPARP